MMKTSLEIISEQITELASLIISAEPDDSFSALIERYNSNFSQFLQIVGSMPENERRANPVIIHVEEKHRELELKLEKNKAHLREAIMSLNSNVSIKQKYYGKNTARMGLNRKG